MVDNKETKVSVTCGALVKEKKRSRSLPSYVEIQKHDGGNERLELEASVTSGEMTKKGYRKNMSSLYTCQSTAKGEVMH